MTKNILFPLVIITLLVACGPVTPVIPEATPEPVISFLPPDLLGEPSNGVTLNVGIFAFNKDIAFLFGDVFEAGGVQQSTLLRSNDGGKHWLEVMHPQKGSSVLEFQMLKTGEGWALVMWVVEGPGAPILFHTTDFGKNWIQLSQVPKPEWYAYPANMVFFDNNNGQMVMSVYGGLHDRLAYMTTYDGGLSWQETGSYTPPFDSPEIQYFALVALYKADLQHIQSTSLDYSSKWNLEVSDESIIINRQLNESYSWSEWETMNTLPKQFDYRDGQIIIP